jgi:hypothetical protein
MRTNAAIVVGLVSLAGCGGVELEAPGVDGGAGLEPISSMREALSGSRLRVRYVEGDDGSRITAGFYDTARNEPCSFGPAEDGRLRCLPTEDLVTVLPGVFADPLCSQRLAVGPCAFPRYARAWSSTCPARSVLFNVAPVAPAALYTVTGGSCVSTPRDPNASYWLITGAAAAEQWIAGAARVDQ